MTKNADRVLIQQDAAPEKIGSFFVPDTIKEKPPQGTVISAGVRSAFREGYKVIYIAGKGTEIIIDGTEYLLIREDDIYGHFEPTA